MFMPRSDVPMAQPSERDRTQSVLANLRRCPKHITTLWALTRNAAEGRPHGSTFDEQTDKQAGLD